MGNYFRVNTDLDSGIYCITNKINGKKYIGQTYSIKNRFYRHISELSKNKHHNSHLQSAWNKYGKDNFDFSVIEYCEAESLNDKEKYWIQKYDSFKNGYNQTSGDIGCRGYRHSEKELAKMIKFNNPKRVVQLDSYFNIIKIWESSSQASKELGFYNRAIVNCCNRDGNVKSVNGYIFIFEEDLNNIDYRYYSVKNICEAKLVGQFNSDMKLIKIWDSLYSIGKHYGKGEETISCVCNHKKNSYLGYIWAFVDKDGTILDGYDYSNIKIRKILPVIQYDLNGNIVKKYSSIKEACRLTGFYKDGIKSSCENENRIYKNYIWKYEY